MPESVTPSDDLASDDLADEALDQPNAANEFGHHCGPVMVDDDSDF